MKKFLFLAGVNGAIAVAGAASATHFQRLGGDSETTLRLAANYQFAHALALGLAAFAARGAARARGTAAGWLFLAGIILFCGGLYLLALTGNHLFAYMVPFGGLSFIAGWLALALAALRLEDGS